MREPSPPKVSLSVADLTRIMWPQEAVSSDGLPALAGTRIMPRTVCSHGAANAVSALFLLFHRILPLLSDYNIIPDGYDRAVFGNRFIREAVIDIDLGTVFIFRA